MVVSSDYHNKGINWGLLLRSKINLATATEHGGISFEELEADLRSIGIELTETGYQNAEMLDSNGDGKLEEDEIDSDYYYRICSGYQYFKLEGDNVIALCILVVNDRREQIYQSKR